MSTRSAIIEKTEDGYRGIYCHSDGYIEYNGCMLDKHYRDPAKVSALIDLGDISVLDANIAPKGEHSFDFDKREEGVVVAYHRDRGEDLNISTGKTIQEVEMQIGHNGFVYVFENGKWTVNGKPLSSEISKLSTDERMV